MEEKTPEGIDSAVKEPDYEFLDPKKKSSVCFGLAPAGSGLQLRETVPTRK